MPIATLSAGFLIDISFLSFMSISSVSSNVYSKLTGEAGGFGEN